ncbi:hypothetical protein Tco_0810936 [Tanacetum coccineum]
MYEDDDGELGDKQEGSSRSLQHIEEFQLFVDAAGLIDIPFFGLKYTWSNKRCDGDNIRKRINRAFGNIELFEAWSINFKDNQLAGFMCKLSRCADHLTKWSKAIEVLNTVVSDEMNNDLEAPITNVEIHKAAK